MLTQIRQQDVEVHARSAEPAVERLATRLLLGGDLGQCEEGVVGAEHPSLGVGDDHAIGRVLEDAQITCPVLR